VGQVVSLGPELAKALVPCGHALAKELVPLGPPLAEVLVSCPAQNFRRCNIGVIDLTEDKRHERVLASKGNALIPRSINILSGSSEILRGMQGCARAHTHARAQNN